MGFGDVPLTSNHTRPFLSFYIVFSSVLAACAFNNFTLMDAEKKQLERLKEKIQKQQSFDILRSLDDGSGTGVTESEFILAVLKHMGTISEEKDIAPWREVHIDFSCEHLRSSSYHYFVFFVRNLRKSIPMVMGKYTVL